MSNFVIINENKDKTISINYPCIEGNLIELGKKVVEKDMKFWVVDKSVIPTDRTFRNAWELDLELLGEHHGVGELEL